MNTFTKMKNFTSNVSPIYAILAVLFVAFHVSADGVRQFLDLRVNISQRSPKYVVFCGRETLSASSVPGHAYVVFGYEDEVKKVCTIDAFGFYPTNKLKGAISFLTSVPSKVANEFMEKGVGDGECMLAVQVSDEDYQQAYRVLKEFEDKRYALREQDCVTFVSAVGTALGLRLPDRGGMNLKLPSQFIRDLVDVNPQNNFLNGTWESTDPKKRFRLTIQGKTCDWIDHPEGGKEIHIKTTVKGIPPKFAFERNNDNEILTLLGFQSSLKQSILAQSPGPSILQVSRDGNHLNATWRALVAIKDAKAKLKNIEFRESIWTFAKVTQ